MMNCQQVRPLLHAYVDRELDVAHCAEIEDHFRQCPECSKLNQGLSTLKSTISARATYYRAPQDVSLVREATPTALMSRRHRWTGSVPLSLVASLLIGVIGFSAGLIVHSRSDDRKLVDVVVAAHVRSLLVEHAVDVASDDRHTVKPWFQGKLDYAPLIINLREQGFTLQGGRLDYLIDRPVAAVVYYRRAHAINVFSWPVSGDKESSLRKLSTQGYHIRNWQRNGMTFWVISDLNDIELDELVELLRDNPSQAVQKP